MDITHPYYIIRTQYVMSINESIRKHPLVACTPYSTTSERGKEEEEEDIGVVFFLLLIVVVVYVIFVLLEQTPARVG